ncbi:hypothetical protein OIDMADRAFT_17619 [Oidiodendron maius Zn]|uniref:Uncharacterized protein n=1 Tax=Oidiodendron maius (strain Zn) TaxID=913774 RepID=A0A0C3DRI4_OIDMZ|nr:hypothetical protein OIDMADRAFT_17619 [Oidiodendron maius Zn]
MEYGDIDPKIKEERDKLKLLQAKRVELQKQFDDLQHEERVSQTEPTAKFNDKLRWIAQMRHSMDIPDYSMPDIVIQIIAAGIKRAREELGDTHKARIIATTTGIEKGISNTHNDAWQEIAKRLENIQGYMPDDEENRIIIDLVSMIGSELGKDLLMDGPRKEDA